MEKIITSADKALSEIGRFVLLWPRLSGISLMLIILLTLLSNGAFKFAPRAHQDLMVTNLSLQDQPPLSTEAALSASALTPSSALTISDVSNKVVFLPGAKPILKKGTKADAPQLAYVSGEVHHSLYSDARKVGLTSRQANQLVQIFSQKNVPKHLRAGDRFYVLYDTNSKKKAAGSILIARLMHSGKDYQWIRFTDPKGHTDYYTPQGQSSKEGISRQPLHYSHIASRFSKSRFHPLLHFMRPHLGVDYAAPIGTPIKAAGDGFIVAAGYKGGYGKAVLLKHDSKYATLYGHLSRFANNIHAGTFVRQGQIIGYVGQSGLASGPHLHYEIHVNNVAHDPLSVPLPGGSVAKAYRNQFLAQARFLLAQLNMHKQVRLADREDPPKRS